MPIDESKVVDMLRNQAEFRGRMDSEVGTFSRYEQNPQFEHGILTMINEVSVGDMRDLVKDIGINNDSLEFYNTQDLQKKRENLLVFPSDH